MITVRYPTGFCVQYNDANKYSRQLDGTIEILRKDAEGKQFYVALVAQNSGALIEFTKPCRMYSALEPGDAEQFDAFMRVLRTFPNSKLKQLKKALTKFDAKSSWKGWKS